MDCDKIKYGSYEQAMRRVDRLGDAFIFPVRSILCRENFYDLHTIVSSASLAGYNILSPISYTYNLYSNKPNEWWTNPNVYMSTGAPPSFPLNYTATINFKDGSSEVVSWDINGWETAE